jgi:hypothetical protein
VKEVAKHFGVTRSTVDQMPREVLPCMDLPSDTPSAQAFPPSRRARRARPPAGVDGGEAERRG